jgi:hypothetical protein
MTDPSVSDIIHDYLLQRYGNLPSILKPIYEYLLQDLVPVLSWIENHVVGFKIFDKIQSLVGVPKFTFVIAFMSACVALLSQSLKTNARLTANVLTVVFPLIQTIKSMNDPQIHDEKKWMTYWSLFGFFSLLDHASTPILGKFRTYFIPKILFFYWMSSKNGANVVYHRLLRHVLKPVKEALPPADSLPPFVEQNPTVDVEHADDETVQEELDEKLDSSSLVESSVTEMDTSAIKPKMTPLLLESREIHANENMDAPLAA